MGEQKQADSKYVIAIEFVSLNKGTERTGSAASEDEAASIARTQLSSLRNGADIKGHDGSTIYSVFAYANNSIGRPDRVTFNERVRPNGRISAAA